MQFVSGLDFPIPTDTGAGAGSSEVMSVHRAVFKLVMALLAKSAHSVLWPSLAQYLCVCECHVVTACRSLSSLYHQQLLKDLQQEQLDDRDEGNAELPLDLDFPPIIGGQATYPARG